LKNIISRLFIIFVIFVSFRLDGKDIIQLTKSESKTIDSLMRQYQKRSEAFFVVFVNPYDCINCNSVLHSVSQSLNGKFVLYIKDYKVEKLSAFRKRFNISSETVMLASNSVLDSIGDKAFKTLGDRSGIMSFNSPKKAIAFSFKEYNSSPKSKRITNYETPTQIYELHHDEFFYYGLLDMMMKNPTDSDSSLILIFRPDGILAQSDKSGRVFQTLELGYDFVDSLFIKPFLLQLPDSLKKFNDAIEIKSFYESHVKGMGVQIISLSKLIPFKKDVICVGYVLIPFIKDAGETLTFHTTGIALTVDSRELTVKNIRRFNFMLDGFYAPYDYLGAYIKKEDGKPLLGIGLTTYFDTLYDNQYIASHWQFSEDSLIFKGMDSSFVVDINHIRIRNGVKSEVLSHFQIDSTYYGFVYNPLVFNESTKKFMDWETDISGFDFYKNLATTVKVSDEIINFETVEYLDNFTFFTVRNDTGSIINRTLLLDTGINIQKVLVKDKSIIIASNPQQGSTEFREFSKPIY